MDEKIIKNILKQSNEPAFRWQQIQKAYYSDGAMSFLDISSLPKPLREELESQSSLSPWRPIKTLISKDKKCLKSILETRDKKLLETVLIKMKQESWSACLSVQIGCPLACEFCATGSSGFERNLSPEEISGQIAYWRAYLKNNKLRGTLGNIIFMGMGEPFLNWHNVKTAIQDLIDKQKFGFGARSLSVSTAGIPEGIKNMAREFGQINLAISLHTANQEKRNYLMPISRKYSLKHVKNALEYYLDRTSRKVFLEYLLMENVNDSRQDAEELANYIKSMEKNYLLHVNLIPCNKTSSAIKPSSPAVVDRFKNILGRMKISVTVRKSMGAEIEGACGQLAAKTKETHEK